mgnify:CR=1 FL=1|jgi:hypothetical protein
MDLPALLAELEASNFGIWIRSLGGWGYAVINLLHVVGVAVLFGSILVLDLRLLGWRRGVPLINISVVTLPLAASGLALAIFTGICLLSVNATEYVGNPFLLIKFIALPLALVNIAWTRRLRVWRLHKNQEPPGGTTPALVAAGALSLLLWLTVISAGRLIAYW